VVEGVGVEVAVLEEGADDVAGDFVVLGGDAGLGFGAELGEVDVLLGMGGVEIAGDQMGESGELLGDVEECGEFGEADGFVGEGLARVEVEADDRESGGGGLEEGVEGAAGEAGVEGGVVDGFFDGEAGEEAGGALGVGGGVGEEAVHVEAVGEFVEEGFVPGFGDDDDVGVGEADDFGEGVDAAGAAFEDVVGHELHGGSVGEGGEGVKRGEFWDGALVGEWYAGDNVERCGAITPPGFAEALGWVFQGFRCASPLAIGERPIRG
jgi:hypothetical protein